MENNSGWDKVEINITVADILANISYPSSDYTFVRNWTIESLDLSNIGGGDLLSVNSNIDLPIGLELNTTLSSSDSAMQSTTGYGHSCAVYDDGILKCWGNNNYGQLGINSTVNSNTPRQVNFSQDVGVTSVDSTNIKYMCNTR